MKLNLRREIAITLMVFLFVSLGCNLISSQNAADSNSRDTENQTENNASDQNQKVGPENDTETSGGVEANNKEDNIESEEDEDNAAVPDIVGHAPLSPNGPWFVVSNPEGLYAFNMDGTGLTLLTRDIPHEFHDLSQGISSTGGQIAYLTGVNTYDNLVLHVIEIPNYQNPNAINLLADDQVDLEARRALVEQNSFAWSNDGQLLAFFGVLDGPSSDLYVFDPSSDEITRLTSGPSQGYQPVWSPNDEYILHVGAESFGTGAGYNMAGVWAASTDGSQVITLPLPADSADEVILGWRNDDTFLSYSWNAGKGAYNLRFTNLFAGIAEEVWEYSFMSVGFGAPDYPWVLLGIDEFSAADNPAGLMGTFFLEPPDYQPNLLFDSPGMIQSIGNSAFIVQMQENAFIISPNNIEDISYIDAVQIFSAQGSPAWYSENGLWLRASGNDIRVTDLPVELAAWGAYGNSILFSVYGDLHVAGAPDWEPILVAAIFFPDEIVLVMP